MQIAALDLAVLGDGWFVHTEEFGIIRAAFCASNLQANVVQLEVVLPESMDTLIESWC